METSFVVSLTSDRLGRGDDELGAILMKSYLKTLSQASQRPASLLLLNAGVKLAVNGSPVLEEMKALEQSGCEVLACGTCLKHFNVVDRLACGTQSTMHVIVEKMGAAWKVVTL